MNCEAPAITSTLMPRICASVQPASLASTPKIMPKGTTTIRNGRLSRAPCQKARRIERSGIGFCPPGWRRSIVRGPWRFNRQFPGSSSPAAAARRMGGGDKALLPLAGRPLLAHVIERLAPQVDPLALNANGDPARFAAFGLPVRRRRAAGGRRAARRGARRPRLGGGARRRRRWSPPPSTRRSCPRDLVAGCAAAAGPAGLASPPPRGRAAERHPTFGLWPVPSARRCAPASRAERRRLGAWAEAQGGALRASPTAAFFNINTPADLARAEGHCWRRLRAPLLGAPLRT